jgi:hypothetical protein
VRYAQSVPPFTPITAAGVGGNGGNGELKNLNIYLKYNKIISFDIGGKGIGGSVGAGLGGAGGAGGGLKGGGPSAGFALTVIFKLSHLICLAFFDI